MVAWLSYKRPPLPLPPSPFANFPPAITTQHGTTMFEIDGKWDLSKLSPQLRRAVAPKAATNRVRGGTGGGGGGGTILHFDMSKDHFQRWVCEDVVKQASSLSGAPASVITLSTVVYPLPLLARNPCYASHPLVLAATAGVAGEGAPQSGCAEEGQVGGPVDKERGLAGQRDLEALETLLTRIVLRPKRDLRERARKLTGIVRETAEKWATAGRDGQGWGGQGGSAEQRPPVRVVGLHVRTHFVRAVSTDTVSKKEWPTKRNTWSVCCRKADHT